MKVNSLFILVLLTSTMFSMPSWALGKLGHQLVCQLSYQLLNDDKKFQIDEMLSHLPRQQVRKINGYLYQKEDKAITFAESCTWADAIKRDKNFKQFKSWHYVNVPRNTIDVTHTLCVKDCIIRAITYHQNKLAIKYNDKERLYALMFLGHWLGDIHQPLHVSYASDLGGNKLEAIPAAGKCDNLHWYWDECLLYPLQKNNSKQSSLKKTAYKNELYQHLLKELNKSPLVDWKNSLVVDWANESLSIIRGEAFSYCQLDNQVCLPVSDNKIKIDETYHQKFQPVLHRRILQAATRLANLLDKSL